MNTDRQSNLTETSTSHETQTTTTGAAPEKGNTTMSRDERIDEHNRTHFGCWGLPHVEVPTDHQFGNMRAALCAVACLLDRFMPEETDRRKLKWRPIPIEQVIAIAEAADEHYRDGCASAEIAAYEELGMKMSALLEEVDQLRSMVELTLTFARSRVTQSTLNSYWRLKYDAKLFPELLEPIADLQAALSRKHKRKEAATHDTIPVTSGDDWDD